MQVKGYRIHKYKLKDIEYKDTQVKEYIIQVYKLKDIEYEDTS